MTNDEKRNARLVYADIIDIPYRKSFTGKQMGAYDRAAQFSAFSALEGYSDMVIEEARETEKKKELSDDETEKINDMLNMLGRMTEDGKTPKAKITYFVPDGKKRGGNYATVTDHVRRINAENRKIELYGRTGISGAYSAVDFGSISNIEIVGENDEP